MIRIRQEIDKDHQMTKKHLSEAIDESIQSEEFYSTEIKMLQNQLKELDKEVCFETTFAGQMHQMELDANEKIILILRELSQKTGHNYLPSDEMIELTNERLEAADADKT